MFRVIGIDGGGTKTEAVLCEASFEDDALTVIKTLRGGASNVNDIGFENAMELYKQLIDELTDGKRDISAVFAGLSGGTGFRNRIDEYFNNLLPDVQFANGSDAENILGAGLGNEDGAGIISGTGSICYARKDGMLYRVGGWGHLFDNAGSGYDIGRDSFNAALRAHDGRDEPTMLTELITEYMEGTPWDRILDAYSRGKSYIASLAPLAFKAYREGDKAAIAILNKSADAICEYIDVAARHFDGNFKVVLAGSILTKDPELADLVREKCRKEAIVSILDKKPVMGAAFLARKLIINKHK